MSTAPPLDYSVLSCSEEEWQRFKAATDEEAAFVRLPPTWREVPVPESDPFYGGRRYLRTDGASVLFSVGDHSGRLWLHVSLVVPRRLPAYAELCEVKDLFIGRERQAVQVFAPRSKHVNIHERCLHLWSCLEPDGDGLPDFGRGGMI